VGGVRALFSPLLRAPLLSLLSLLSGCFVSIDPSKIESAPGNAPLADAGEPNPDASAANGADADILPSEPDSGCPPGAVPIAPAGASAFCIDATEVSNSAYASFLASHTGSGGLPDSCRFENSLTPADWPFTPGREDFPVVGVDWCQAYAYCAWAHKRLCGRIGGGELGGAGTTAQSQWFAACSGAAQNSYPYGENYIPAACNGDGALGGLARRATFPGCVGSSPQLFDMSGNASEWIDSCVRGEGGSGANDMCEFLGGGFADNPDGLACDSSSSDRRSRSAPDRGFRCCLP
jgi:formylglycine-generating enzyme required for sulfatase activity